ncbi:MAG: hypothetical protein KC464_08395, partial [Myxococcales bacterium]|nr:hypothetical protein [Myxococcales bacterium]
EARRAPPPRGPDDEGTPVDVALTPPPEGLPSFVAGEIDVPTPAPEIVEADGVFTAASELLGPRGEADDPEPVRGK